MKAYCWLTESHAGLLEEFLLPSLPKGMPISVVVGEQDCPSGEFMKEGWRESMKARCKWWAEIVANEKEPFLLLDADVQFFKDPREDLASRLQDFELVGQYDVYTPICCGLMAVRPTRATRQLFIHIWQQFEGFANDQIALNSNLDGLDWASLPETYWTIGQANGGQVWTQGEEVNPPADLIAHHGNFTVGLEDKAALMNQVKGMQ